MNQDKSTGSAAGRWGRNVGPRLGKALGGIAQPDDPANVFMIGRHQVAIKIAHAKTPYVGVTLLTLDRVDEVYGAWKSEAGVFNVWALPVRVFRECMKPTASKGSAAGREGQVRRSVFKKRGTLICTVRI